MTKPPGAGRPRKSDQKLSMHIIVATALPIVRRDGAEALSFRVLADLLGVTPMAVTYHSGSKKELLAGLVDAAFKDAVGDVEGDLATDRVRFILHRYCERALVHAHLLRAILSDTSLMSAELFRITDALRSNTKVLNDGDEGDVLLHILIDYTHGFVLSATAGDGNPLKIDDFQRGIDWILGRAENHHPSGHDHRLRP